MCDICKGSNYFDYKKRVTSIRHLIKTHAPDLIALQEVRSVTQIKEILKGMNQYDFITSDSFFLSYADPTIIYDKNKFTLKNSGQFWLGPEKGGFSLGWKFSLPRQVIWAKLQSKTKHFIFSSTHFDNRIENLKGSAHMVNNFFKNNKLPIILAADTNMTVDMPEYKELTHGVFINAFDIKKDFHITGKSKEAKDLCYLRKGKKFPACRVDHILLSKNTKWDVHSFSIDTSKKDNNFPSDHRAVISLIEMK